jgi:hypothetical protein
MSCACRAVVCAEKEMEMGVKASSGSPATKRFMYADLPVPVGPHTSVRRERVTSRSTMYENCVVSTVCTMIFANVASSSMSERGVTSSQDFHPACSGE